MRRPGFDVVAISLLAPGPSWGDGELAAARVLMGLLAGDFTSRLGTDLREERGLTYGVDGEVQVWERSGRLRVHLEVPEGRAAEALLAMRGQLDRLLDEGVGEEEVARARRALILDAARDVETGARLAATLEQLWLRGEGLARQRERLEAIAAVRAEDVERAAARWLGPERRVWVLTGDPAALEPAAAAAGLRPDRRIGARELGEQP